MPLIDWNTKSFAPDYFTQGNIKYERRFIDAESFNEGLQQIPISFDTTYFGILCEDGNISIHENEECSTGSFFAPFVHCETKEKLILTISKLVKALGEALKSQSPYVRIFVYRHVDVSGKRFFAIGGTNFRAKHKIIHELNIKTMLENPKETTTLDSWETVINELEADIQDPFCCQIEKEELLGFESRSEFIEYSSEDVLVMLNKKSGFNCQHFSIKRISPPTNKPIIFPGIKSGLLKAGKHFKLQTIRFESMEELNQAIRWMIEAFRTITGSSRVKAKALYFLKDDSSIDASIICSRPKTPPLIEEEDSF